jgi:type IV pilus assembly protein PilE
VTTPTKAGFRAAEGWAGVQRRSPHARVSGLSVLEILIVLAVLVGLAAYAVPAWHQHRISLRRVDARSELLAIAQRLQQCRASLAAYDNPACTVRLPILTATGSYRLEGALGDRGFRLVAVPQGEQVADPCGQFLLDDRGARSVTGSLTAAACWGPED